jgi:hypothetical protein
LYEPEEWRSLVETDPVIAQIARGPKLALVPYGQTT